jgi:hypothetical protein
MTMFPPLLPESLMLTPSLCAKAGGLLGNYAIYSFLVLEPFGFQSNSIQDESVQMMKCS